MPSPKWLAAVFKHIVNRRYLGDRGAFRERGESRRDPGFVRRYFCETVDPNNLVVEADGTAAEVEKAFNTSLSQYSLNGTTFFANTTNAQIPSSLQGIVVAVLGLNSMVSFRRDLAKLAIGQQPATDRCTPPECPTPDLSNDTFSAQQYQIAYDAACPSDNAKCPAYKFPTGSTTVVGIIAEGDLTQVVTDLRSYETLYSLPEVPVTVVNAGVASSDTSGEDEWDLDSQTSTGIAQQVSHLYFYVATSMTDSDLALAINKAVTSNKVKAFNMSFGECEFQAYIDGSMLVDDEVFGEAALQGITPFASADDQGSACPLVGTNGVPLSGPRILPIRPHHLMWLLWVEQICSSMLITLTITKSHGKRVAAESATSKLRHSGRATPERAASPSCPARRQATEEFRTSPCALAVLSMRFVQQTSSWMARPRS